MTLPFARLSAVSGGGAVAPQSTAGINCVVGYTSSGAANALELYLDIPSLVAARGAGPGVEAAAEQIVENGACYLCAPTSDVAGVAGSVTEVGTSPAITVSGTPNDDYRVRVKVTTGGVIGTSQVSVSIDGGNTYAAPVATASTLALTGTGLTLAFAAGTYVADDTASFDCEAPFFGASNFTTAANAAIADPRDFGTMIVVGKPHGADDAAKASALATMAVAAQTAYVAAKTAGKDFRIVLDAPFATASALITAFASTDAEGVLVVAEPIDLQSPISNLIHKRPAASTYGARVASITVQKHPGEVRGGPLPSRVRKIYNSAADRVSLDAARFVTFRTIPRRTGYFVTRGPTMAGPTMSDFSEHQYCRVLDLASAVGRDALLHFLNTELDTISSNNPAVAGRLSAVQAEAIDAYITSALRRALVDTKFVVDAAGFVDRTIDVDSTNSLGGSIRIKRKGYAEYISWEISMTRGV